MTGQRMEKVGSWRKVAMTSKLLWFYFGETEQRDLDEIIFIVMKFEIF